MHKVLLLGALCSGMQVPSWGTHDWVGPGKVGLEGEQILQGMGGAWSRIGQGLPLWDGV